MQTFARVVLFYRFSLHLGNVFIQLINYFINMFLIFNVLHRVHHTSTAFFRIASDMVRCLFLLLRLLPEVIIYISHIRVSLNPFCEQNEISKSLQGPCEYPKRHSNVQENRRLGDLWCSVAED